MIVPAGGPGFLLLTVGGGEVGARVSLRGGARPSWVAACGNRRGSGDTRSGSSSRAAAETPR